MKIRKTVAVAAASALVAIGGGVVVADAANHPSLGSTSGQQAGPGGPGGPGGGPGFGGPPPGSGGGERPGP